MAKFVAVTAVIFAFIAAPALGGVDKVEITPNLRELLTTEGGTQEVACTVTTNDVDAKLHWEMPSSKGVSRIQKSEVGSDGTELVYRLLFANFSSDNVGKYVCQLRSGASTELSRSEISIFIAKENKTEPVYEDKMPSASLSCSISYDLPMKPKIESMKWLLKNGTKWDDEKFKVVEENNTLVIDGPIRGDAGLYIARFEIQNASQPYDCEVRFLASPLVLDFDKSKNLIQDDNMELQCKVKGYPTVAVTWYKDDKLLNVSAGGDRVQQLPLDGFENARLKIKNVEFSDAGDYKCEAHSALFNETSSKVITVRVKDRLAALWPFLGIVGEVVVLCTIIFIYEKRRNKRAEQEENTAHDVKNGEKKGSVRHRGQKK